MVDEIARFFTSNLGNLVCCGAIFFYGAYKLSVFYHKNQSIHQEINPVIKHLTTFQTAEEFPEHFYDFEDTISKSILLKNAWREFKEVLINPGDHPFIERNVIVNTRRPQHFFAETSIIKPRINMQLVHSVSNKLTGFGLLGTFVGLVAGIYLASSGIASNNIEEAKQALSYLLHGASTAFWTSIIGLAGSIVFSSREKRWTHERKQLFDHLNELFEQRLEFLSVERLNSMILEESRKQSNSLSSFATDLATSLGRVMNEQVSEPIGDILERINISLDTLNQNQSRAADETIERLIKEFSSSISGAAGKEMQAFATTIQDLSKELRDQMGAMNENYQSMQENTKNTIDDLSSAFSDGANQIKQEISTGVAHMVAGVTESVHEMTTMLKAATEESAENMRSIATQFDESISKLRDSATDIAEITRNNKTLADEITQLLNSLGEVHVKIQHVVEPIVETVKSLTTSSENLNYGITLLANTSEQTTNAVSSLHGIQQEIAVSWRNYEQRFSDVDTSLGKTLDSLQHGYTAFADSTTQYLQGMNQNAAQIVEKLSGAVLELRESLENLEHLPSSVNKLELLPSTVAQLDNSLKGLPQMMTNLAVLLKDVPDMVQKLTQQIELAE
ncbi:hypothetical protein [Tolumonas auensis]|uniref:hypothetical protein n=1 Tax=Tolumonas auensis TaxID=43948 RepID=UPI002AA8EBB1|nr:hypothetical protein [Tolumonas auensis]